MNPLLFAVSDLRTLRRLDYARAYDARGETLEALDIYRSITEDFGDWPPAWFEYGKALGDAGVDAFKRYLELDPDDHMGASLHLARLDALAAPEKPPEAFIAALFDEYAERFEDALLTQLDYQAPQILSQFLGDGKFHTVLDLGCGTGLMGEAMIGQCYEIIGVDLSDEMLKRAEEKQLYAALHCGEVEDWLSHSKQSFDLIMAADVFSYFGALENVISLCASKLRAGGTIAFTCEKARLDEDWYVRKTLRYGHSAAYIEGLLTQAGLTGIQISEAKLRMDEGAPIIGLYVIAHKLGD